MFNREKFLELCKEKHFDANTLAPELGLAPSTVSKWFTGEAIPYPAYKNKLSSLLECTVEELFEDSQADNVTKGKDSEPITKEQHIAKPRKAIPKKIDPAQDKPEEIPEPEHVLVISETKPFRKDFTSGSESGDESGLEPVKPKQKTSGEKKVKRIDNKGILPDDTICLMKATKFQIKDINKNMSKSDIYNWLKTYHADCYSRVRAILEEEDRVSDAVNAALLATIAVNPNLEELLKVAEQVDDTTLNATTDFLRRIK